MKHFVRYIILFLMIATVTGCYDEFMKEEIIGEGKYIRHFGLQTHVLGTESDTGCWRRTEGY